MVIPYVPADRVTRMRLLDERAMPDTCAIVSVAPGTVNIDGSSEPGVITTTTVPCRMVTGANATETLIAMRLVDVASSVLAVPVGTVVSPKDTITHNGMTYQVMGTNAGESFATNLTLAVKQIS